MNDTTLFSPDRIILANVDNADEPPQVYEFKSRLTQAYVDEVNRELIRQGQRPAFIRWDDVHLEVSARNRRGRRATGVGFLSVLTLLPRLLRR